MVDLASSRGRKAPFSNHFVQLCHSYAGPHEEAKLTQGPNGTARITAGPVPSTGGEMSGIGKNNMLDTIHQINPIIKFITSYLGTSQNPSFQKGFQKSSQDWGATALRYFAPRHPPEKVGKKLAAVVAWVNWNFMRWSSPQLPWIAEPLTEVAKMAIPALQYMDHLERASEMNHQNVQKW